MPPLPVKDSSDGPYRFNRCLKSCYTKLLALQKGLPEWGVSRAYWHIGQITAAQSLDTLSGYELILSSIPSDFSSLMYVPPEVLTWVLCQLEARRIAVIQSTLEAARIAWSLKHPGIGPQEPENDGEAVADEMKTDSDDPECECLVPGCCTQRTSSVKEDSASDMESTLEEAIPACTRKRQRESTVIREACESLDTPLLSDKPTLRSDGLDPEAVSILVAMRNLSAAIGLSPPGESPGAGVATGNSAVETAFSCSYPTLLNGSAFSLKNGGSDTVMKFAAPMMNEKSDSPTASSEEVHSIQSHVVYPHPSSVTLGVGGRRGPPNQLIRSTEDLWNLVAETRGNSDMADGVNGTIGTRTGAPVTPSARRKVIRTRKLAESEGQQGASGDVDGQYVPPGIPGVSYDKSLKQWKARWRDAAGLYVSRSFSTRRYGWDEARRLAIDARLTYGEGRVKPGTSRGQNVRVSTEDTAVVSEAVNVGETGRCAVRCSTLSSKGLSPRVAPLESSQSRSGMDGSDKGFEDWNPSWSSAFPPLAKVDFSEPSGFGNSEVHHGTASLKSCTSKAYLSKRDEQVAAEMRHPPDRSCLSEPLNCSVSFDISKNPTERQMPF